MKSFEILTRYAVLARLVTTVFASFLESHCQAANQFIAITAQNPEVKYSAAKSVSDGGDVVVGTLGVGADKKAFRWNAMDGLKFIDGSLEGFGVSGDGRVVVGGAKNPQNGLIEPMRWTQTGGLELLGGVPGENSSLAAYAYGASHDGSVLVGSTGVVGTIQSFVWTESSGITLLDLQPPSPSTFLQSNSLDVSSEGSRIVGGGYFAAGGESAFLWTTQDGIVLLGPGFAKGISDDGAVLVGESDLFAFRWTKETGMTLLQPSSNPGAFSIDPRVTSAMATTGHGEAVLGSQGGTVAFLWTETYGLESLSLVLSHRFGLQEQLAGWRLEEAANVSPDGRAIVGKGINPVGEIQAWLVRLDRPIFFPEPNAAWLVAAPALVASASRRRSPRAASRA